MSEEETDVIVAIGLALNFLDVAVPTPIEILPGCVLRRASDEEIPHFREAIVASGDAHHILNHFEADPPPAYGQSWERLPQERWRYWVIETTLSEGLHNVARASRLTDIELPCSYMLMNLPDCERMDVSRALSSDIFCNFVRFGLPEPRQLDLAAIEQIRQISRGLKNISDDFPSIARGIEMYQRLDRMGGTIAATYSFAGTAAQAPLYVLGVFAVIESLLTHDPKGGYDSLTHQIKAKMKLLNERFSKPLDYSAFQPHKSDKIWSTLYSFRSAIAHGQEPDFNGELKILKDERTAVSFLDDVAKALLRHALEESQLILDLQAC